MGTYESKNAARFCLRIIARRLGYLLVLSSLFIQPGLARAENLPTGAIRGQIIEQDGQPLVNIQVLAAKQESSGVYATPFPYYLYDFPPWVPEGLNEARSLSSYGFYE